MDVNVQGPERYLGLSFSGGGYRAASFAVGTLALLEDLNLNETTLVLSGVSGGSIALGAYLCAKAGAEAEIDAGTLNRKDWFYKNYFQPFLKSLSTETMAESFVSLSGLLKEPRLIKAAADANDVLFQELLGQPATIGSAKLQALLNHNELAPDYAFFNASDISSLNLFRFGIQKHHGDPGSADGSNGTTLGFGSTDVILGQWIFSCQPQANLTSNLLTFSQDIRLADCVTASHAFPFGLEPMLFPHDFFASDQPEGMQAIRAFSGSEVCNGQKALALLDGGLYDNLGLASVEDIRAYDWRRRQGAALREHKQAGEQGAICSTDSDLERSAFVVIATDVDNIQPSLSFYEAIEAPKPEEQKPRLSFSRAIVKRSKRLWRFLLAVALITPAVPLILWTKSFGIRWLNQEVPELFKTLGFSQEFIQDQSPINQRAISQTLSWRQLMFSLPLGDQWQNLVRNLKANLIKRRLGQLTPTVSGYLKRTRSLTYGYLETNYARERQQGHGQAPHLVRNMIFELTQGADADPDYAARLITLPVRPFGSLNNQEEEVFQESSAMRKMRHAHLAAGLLLERAARQTATSDASAFGSCGATEAGSDQPIGFGCLIKIWQKGEQELPNSCVQGDADLRMLVEKLHLVEVAKIWSSLWSQLIVREEQEPAPDADQQDGLINPEMIKMVELVRTSLQKALKDSNLNISQVLENCRTTPEAVSTLNSWIPMICEMATNLPTTLWIKDYIHYIPNHVDDRRVVSLGSWYKDSFDPKIIPDALKEQPILKLTANESYCPAAMITTLAGYLTTAFNLLEYYYAFLEQSDSLVHGLSRTLTEESLFDDSRERPEKHRILELPFAVRQAAARCIQQHWQALQQQSDDPQGATTLADADPILLANLKALKHPETRLQLLRPWLNSRGPLPESWWSDPMPESP